MQQESNQSATKQDIKDLKNFIMDGFTGLNEKIDRLEESTDQRFDAVDRRFDNLENKIDRRISVTEDRVHILKNVVEKGFKTKVAW